jgi:hypothetical protein
MNPMWFWALIALAVFLVLTTVTLARGGFHRDSRVRAPFAFLTLAGALLVGVYSLTTYLGLSADTSGVDELKRVRARLTLAQTEVDLKQRSIDAFAAERTKLQAETAALNDQQSRHLVAVLQSIYGVQGQTSKEQHRQVQRHRARAGDAAPPAGTDRQEPQGDT